MLNQIIFVIVASSSVMCVQTPTRIESESVSAETKGKGITLRVTSLLIRDNRVDLSYEISNNSREEIWLCDDIDGDSPIDFETIASLDGSSLVIRLRLGIPMGWWRPQAPRGRYVRLMAGGRYRASLWLALPVRQQPVLASRSAHHIEERKETNRLLLEVGYFSGSLSARIATLARDANEIKRQWQAEEAQIEKDEHQLIEKRSELAKKMRSVTDVEEGERLQEELDEVIAQEDAWTWLNRRSLYVESLGLEISVGLSDRLEEIDRDFGRNKQELIIPHEYCQEVEQEHFLRVAMDKVRVPYLPPRYLDLAKMVPWGKTQAIQVGKGSKRVD